MEKVAEKAGKAAPTVAIAGALVAAPAQQALAASAKPAVSAKPAAVAGSAHSVLVSSVRKAQHAAAGSTYYAAARSTFYTVRSGDTLSMIAWNFYRNAGDWQWLYHENASTVSDPNLIYPGETLFVPAQAPAGYTLTAYVPRHAKPAARASTDSDADGDVDSSFGSGSAAGTGPASGGSGSTTLSGTLSCSGLEQLWVQAGGNPADAVTAASVAMAESSGNQYALSRTSDYGYWQINISHGALATFNAYGNARAAVIISHDGTDWSPWTTYTSGAYVGRC
jgi:LysM repeat protein